MDYSVDVLIGGLLLALFYLGVAALPFLLLVLILQFIGRMIGRGIAQGLKDEKEDEEEAEEEAADETSVASERAPGGRLFWTLLWLAAGALALWALSFVG